MISRARKTESTAASRTVSSCEVHKLLCSHHKHLMADEAELGLLWELGKQLEARESSPG